MEEKGNDRIKEKIRADCIRCGTKESRAPLSINQCNALSAIFSVIAVLLPIY